MRILVVDDERPVVEGISLIVKRDLSGEFEIVGTASSGREAIEKASVLAPDIVLMDVRMPGISGMDAIREIRRRGSASSFVLITAYELFEIAREAVELGVLDYLLKPVSKDRLSLALRSAAAVIEGREERERREMEYREREEGQRPFVESAFLLSLMLGERSAAELDAYRQALGLAPGAVMAGAAAFLPAPGAPDPEAEARAAHESFRRTIRYKTGALAGPFVAGRCAILLPLRGTGAAGEAEASLREVVGAAHAGELARGRIKLGFGGPRPLAEAADSWSEALAALLRSAREGGAPGKAAPAAADPEGPEPDDDFMDALDALSPDRASLALEGILSAIAGKAPPPAADRYRVICLFGSAYALLARKGLLSRAEARRFMDLDDLAAPAEGETLALAARARFSRIAWAMRGAPRRSPALAAAIAYIKENFARPLTLESVADLVSISPGRLSRLFVEEAGRGFSEYLIEYRIEKAKEMLALPETSIKQVSAACGYPDPNYFSRLFKKATGLTPSAFSTGASEANDEER